MNKLLWSFHVLLTLTFVVFGLQKVFFPIPDLIDQGMLWIEDFTAWQVRAIGALEVIGALGLNLPYLVKRLPKVFVPLAAAGLALTMVGGALTHIVRGDPAPSIVITSLLVVMGAVLAIARFRQITQTGATTFGAELPAVEAA